MVAFRTEDGGIISAATAASPSRRNRDPDCNNEDKDKDRKSCKGQWGRPPRKNDRKEGSGNGKKDNETTPRRIVVVKTEKNKSKDVTITAATPVFTQQRARVKKSNNDDTAV